MSYSLRRFKIYPVNYTSGILRDNDKIIFRKKPHFLNSESHDIFKTYNLQNLFSRYEIVFFH